VARLREIDPIRDAVSYFELVWYEPAERWMLYEMVPAYMSETGPTVPLQILEELKGTDPELIPETARSSRDVSGCSISRRGVGRGHRG
jgi:hypothetical protein